LRVLKGLKTIRIYTH